jgi:WD40 repeat protein
MTIPKRVDVFVSYRHLEPTRTWVRETLVPYIDAAGFSVILDAHDFRAGDVIVDVMRRASEAARVTLAVVDEHYGSSGFTRLERTMAKRLVAVIRDPRHAAAAATAAAAVELTGSDDPATVIDTLRKVLRRAFVLEAKPDEEWVEGVLVPHLEHAGVATDHVGDLPVGGAVMDTLKAHLSRANRVVVVLSTAYIRERRQEDSLFTHLQAAENTTKAIPVRRGELAKVPAHYDPQMILDVSKRDLWDAALEAICAAIEVDAPPPLHVPPCPYPGMRTYGAGQAHQFFGRRDEIADVVTGLRLGRFVALIGPSASGKSSLARAGVVPIVRERGIGDAEDVQVEIIRPGDQPLAALTGALERWANAGPQQALLLVVDQLEEAFARDAADGHRFLADLARLVGDDARVHVLVTLRADFFAPLMESPLWAVASPHSNRIEVGPLAGDALREAIREPARGQNVVVEEALVERLAAHTEGQPGLLPFLQETLVRLWEELDWRLLTLDAYARLGDGTEPGLFHAISDVAQRTVDELEARRPGTTRVVRGILVRLVSFESRPWTRRRVAKADLVSAAPDPATFELVFGTLATARLLTTDKDDRNVTVVDLSHEAIIRGWPQLRAWLEEQEAAETERRRLLADAVAWRDSGRAEHRLLRDVDLLNAQRFLASDPAGQLGVDPVTEEHVARSAEAERSRNEADVRHRRRRRRVAVGVFAATVAIALALGVLALIAFRAQREAELEAAQRLSTELLAAASANEGSDSLVLQSLLVRAADRITPTPLSLVEMLTTSERAPPIVRKIDAPTKNVGLEAVWADEEYLVVGDGEERLHVYAMADGDPQVDSERSIELGHGVFAIARQPGSSIVAVGGGTADNLDGTFVGSDGWVDLADLADPELVPRRLPLDGDSLVSALAFDGERLLVGRWDGSVTIVEVGGGTAEVVRTLEIPSNGLTDETSCAIDDDDRNVRSLLVGGDGAWLAAAANNCVIAVWDLTTDGPPRLLLGHSSKVRALAELAHSSALLSTGDDRTLRWWNMAEPDPTSRVLTDAADENRPVAMCAAPDGSAVVTAGRDHRARRWTVGAGFVTPDPTFYAAHTTTIRGVACLSGRRFVTVAGDGVVVWDLNRAARGARRLDIGEQSGGRVAAVAVRPSERPDTALAVATDGAGEVLVEPAGGGEPQSIALDGIVPHALAYSADGRYLAVAGNDGQGSNTVAVYDASSLARQRRDVFAGAAVTAIAIADGDDVAIATEAGEISRLVAGEPATSTSRSALPIRSLAFGPDGTLVAGDFGGTLSCYAPTAPASAAEVKLGRSVDALATGADGTVVAGTAEGLVTIFRAALDGAGDQCDPEAWARTSLPVLHGSIVAVALAVEGSLLFAASSDGAIDVWDVPRSRRLGELTAGAGQHASFVAVDAAGTTIAVASRERAVVYVVDRDGLRARLCAIAGRELTADELATFFPGGDHREAARCAADAD